MRRSLLVLGLLLAPGLLAGCVDQASLPRLNGEITQDTIEWGEAASLVVRNAGEGPRPAPITIEVVAANGTVVRTFEDVTAGRDLPANGQISVDWNGLDDDGRPVLWGNYTMRVVGTQVQDTVQLLRPPHHALTIDPIPREAQTGTPIEFRVNNTGTTWVNGSMTVVAGRDDTILYNNTVRVELAPDEGYSLFWDGRGPDGEPPEPQKYLVASRVEPDDGPTPFAQDVFELTER